MPKDKEEAQEVDLEAYLTKPPTDLQERFADYIVELGYDPSAAKTKMEAFKEGVRLAVALRMIFQASPENRSATKARRAERAAAALAAPDEDEKPKAKKGKKADPEPEAPKAKAGKKAKVAEDEAPKAKAGKGGKGKGRRAAATADEDDVAPF